MKVPSDCPAFVVRLWFILALGLVVAAARAQVKPPGAPVSIDEKAAQGDPVAQNQLGLKALLAKTPSYTNAFKWFRLAAEQGLPIAEHNLGGLYFKGNGVPQDYKEALRWYQKAAEAGFAPAQSFMGWMYATGKGVEEDPKEAVKWYLKAAQQRDKEAQFSLGLLLLDGEPDYVEAYKWINLSAAQGNTNAIKSRAKLAVSMTAEQIAEGQRRASEFDAKKDAAEPPKGTAPKQP